MAEWRPRRIVIREPLIEIKVPKLIRPPILLLPEYKLGPLGLIEARRVEPGELLPVRIKLIKGLRERV